MKLYTGVKVVEAKEDNGGYLVQFSNGETSWRTKQQFEDNYRECEGMPFSVALEAMKRGKRVRRPIFPDDFSYRIIEGELVGFSRDVGQTDVDHLYHEDILAEDWEILV